MYVFTYWDDGFDDCNNCRLDHHGCHYYQHWKTRRSGSGIMKSHGQTGFSGQKRAGLACPTSYVDRSRRAQGRYRLD